MNKLRAARFKQGEENVWAKADQPLEKRVATSFLFGLKKALVAWGYNKAKVWVDEQAQTLTAVGELVVTAGVESETGASDSATARKLKCDWAGRWGTWGLVQNSPELKELQDQAAQTLQRAGGKGAKGGGKATKGH